MSTYPFTRELNLTMPRICMVERLFVNYILRLFNVNSMCLANDTLNSDRTGPGKSWNFIVAFSRTGKSWKKVTGLGKFWKSVKLK